MAGSTRTQLSKFDKASFALFLALFRPLVADRGSLDYPVVLQSSCGRFFGCKRINRATAASLHEVRRGGYWRPC